MKITEGEALANHTTFRLGGPAALFLELDSAEELPAAAALAREHGLPIRALGGGSNLLVPNEGIEAAVIRFIAHDIIEDNGMLIASAGARWDTLVDVAAAHGWWGIENLAGIPGTVGGAVVQNIGAYGAALSDTFVYADAVDIETGVIRRFKREECAFGYRDSVFKHDRSLIITRAAFAFSESKGMANTSYRDPNTRYRDLGRILEENPRPSPSDVAAAVRAIRAEKFPDLSREGTAGSFFGNPILPNAQAEALRNRFPGLPLFSLPETRGMKVPLGWILDTVLHMRGHSRGGARVYEKHALVIVTRPGAVFEDVDMLAREIEKRVREMIGITIEREVETFAT